MTSTTQLIFVVSIMLAFNIGLVFFQGAVLDVNPAAEQFFDVDKSPYSNYVQNDTLIVDDSLLPVDAETVTDANSGNIFTDTYKTIKAWTQDGLKSLGFISNILRQPYGFLVDVGVPGYIALAIGVFWYLFAIIIVVSWWMGR